MTLRGWTITVTSSPGRRAAAPALPSPGTALISNGLGRSRGRASATVMSRRARRSTRAVPMKRLTPTISAMYAECGMAEQVEMLTRLDHLPLLEDDDVVGEVQGIGVLMGDHHGRELQPERGSRAARVRPRAGSGCRGPRATRRAATAGVRGRGRARSRLAAAGHPKAPSDGDRCSRPDAPARAPHPTRCSITFSLIFCIFSPKATLSKTERCGNRT